MSLWGRSACHYIPEGIQILKTFLLSFLGRATDIFTEVHLGFPQLLH
jgi:hypothetical protein